jgi:hypothetical protein
MLLDMLLHAPLRIGRHALDRLPDSAPFLL